jgi:hypothetical protein
MLALMLAAELWSAREAAKAEIGELLAHLDTNRPGLKKLAEKQDVPDSFYSALSDYFAQRGRVSFNTTSVLPDLARTADDVLSGRFTFAGNPPLDLPRDLSWDENPSGRRRWAFLLHKMHYVVALTQSYQDSGDPAYLQRAEDLVLDWIGDNYDNLDGPPPSDMTWHDHATALRVRAWLEFFEEWTKTPLASGEEIARVLSAIVMHAEKLADEDFYTEKHNHGIDQDYALLAIGACFPEMSASGSWVTLGATRLREQVRQTISPNGIHLEHSPGYQLFMLNLLGRILKFTERHRLDVFPPDKLGSLIARMASALAYMAKPDGHLPTIGDTTASAKITPENVILSQYANKDPVLRYVLSRGRDGVSGRLAAVYKQEGYAYLRDSWPGPDRFGDAVHIVFTAAANPGLAHKHADDLSFVLTGYGKDFLVDPGMHSFDHEDPARKFIVSSAAHNVVQVDGIGFEGHTARIDAVDIHDGYVLIEASHTNYPGLRHRRTLAYLRPGTLLLVDDLGSVPGGALSRRARKFEQLFHFAPDINVSLTRPGVGLAAPVPDNPGQSRLYLRQLLWTGDDRMEVIEGATDPLQGWVTKSQGSLMPAPVVAFSKLGSSARFVTLIHLAPDAVAPIPGVEVSEPSPIGALSVGVSMPGGGFYEVSVSSDGSVAMGSARVGSSRVH